MATRSGSRFVLAVVALSCFADADALCPPPGLPPPARYVGDVATDSKCTDNDIQSAINNATCPGTSIVITREHTYTQQHLTVSNKNLVLTATGDGVFCQQGGGGTIGGGGAVTQPLLTISGTGTSSVLEITGNSTVTVEYLEITGGGGSGFESQGGGINFAGTGSLTLSVATIDLNSAQFGGGIAVTGSGGTAQLYLGDYTVIESNTASGNGGGIGLDGTAQLTAVRPFTTIGFNHAPNGKGGGIAVVGPATAFIGSPGYVSIPVINGNDAAVGGGISAVVGTDVNDNVDVELFTTDPNNPVTVSGNAATSAGGGIYLEPIGSGISFAYFCATDFHIDGNAAPEGAAIYGNTDSNFGNVFGAIITLTRYAGCTGPNQVACASGVECSTVSDNTTTNASHQLLPGSIIAALDHSELYLKRVTIRGNAAAHAIRAVDPTGQSSIRNSLIAGNDFTAERITIDDDGNGGAMLISSSTIADNAHFSGSAINAAHDLTLVNSIVDEFAMSTLHTTGTPTITASGILADDPTGLAGQPDIAAGAPTYVDAANGDYHLRAVIQNGEVMASLGIDWVGVSTDDGNDLDNNPRNLDVPQVPDHLLSGAFRDIGCYEAQPIADRVFADGVGDPVSLVYVY